VLEEEWGGRKTRVAGETRNRVSGLQEYVYKHCLPVSSECPSVMTNESGRKALGIFHESNTGSLICPPTSPRVTLLQNRTRDSRTI
jgi:hypothetical protein